MRVWLELGRVSNLPTVWTNTLAGVALAAGVLAPLPLALLMVAMTCMYVGGMFLNDAFDREIDAKERPDRPIPSGRVTATQVFGAGFGLLLLGVALSVGAANLGQVALLGPAASAVGLAAVIVVYDMHHKGNPLSPLLMGLCRVGVYVTAASCVGGAVFSKPLLWGMAGLLGYLIGLTYVAKQETLNRIGNLWPLAFLAVPFLAVHVLSEPLARGCYAALLMWVLWTLRGLMGSARNVGAAVTRFIAGLCILDAMWVASQGHQVLVLACAVGFVLTRLFQRVIAGT